HPLIIKVATLQPSRMQVYFIDSDDYFIHKTISELELNLYPEENDERMMFFSYGVIETVKKLRWEPCIVHCQGWVSCLAPLYMKTLYADDPTFKNARIVYSLYNDSFDGNLDARFVDKLEEAGIPADIVARLKGKDFNYTELMKLAIDFSDEIAISSPEASQELIDYARSTGKPIIEYPGDDNNFAPYVEAYNNMIK
ncbi:MAG: glycogen/starch synthase, partial [Muribaculaceae bacterium]|nr:glycogen/starch synthase [Muribaculaceae bacterium]